MYMRIVRAQPPAGQADAIAEKWKTFYPERMRAQPGFRHAHFGALLARLLREFRDTLGQSGPAQDPEMTLYEVVAEA